MIAILEVHAVDRVPQVSAPVTRLVPFKVGPAVQRETLFGTERFFLVRFGGRGPERERFGNQRFVAPAARRLLHRRICKSTKISNSLPTIISVVKSSVLQRIILVKTLNLLCVCIFYKYIQNKNV